MTLPSIEPIPYEDPKIERKHLNKTSLSILEKFIEKIRKTIAHLTWK